MLKELIKEVNQANKLAQETQQKALSEIRIIADKLNKKLAKFNLSVHRDQGLGGSATDHWNPCIYLNPNPKPVKTNKCFHYDGNKFYWSTFYYNPYIHSIIDESPPYDCEELLTLCKSFSEEFGIKVEIQVSDVIDKLGENEFPDCEDDLLLLHPGGKIIIFGKISYMAWDCQDQYGIVEDKSGKHLYYGTSAHSSDMNHYLGPNSDYSKFFDLHKDNDTYIDNIELLKEILI